MKTFQWVRSCSQKHFEVDKIIQMLEVGGTFSQSLVKMGIQQDMQCPKHIQGDLMKFSVFKLEKSTDE